MKILITTIVVAGLALGTGLTTEVAPRWLAVLGLTGADKAATEQYLTATIDERTIRRTISATGSLQAVATVEVSSQLSGQVAELAANFNDPVVAGAPLAVLDQRGLRSRVTQAEAELRMGSDNVAILSAQLEKAAEAQNQALAQRAVFEARIAQAQVALDAASAEMARAEQLAGRGTAAKTTVEDARFVRDGAASALREAEAIAAAHEFAIASARAGRREAEAELANAKAALPLKQAAVELAQLDLDRSTIRSPIDGVVIGRNVERGQTVAVSLDAPVLFLIAGDLAQMEIHANIDETDIGEIAVGQQAAFSVDAFPGRTFQARVTEIRKAARLIQGVVTYTVVLEAANKDRLLLPGMTSTVRIAVEETGIVPALPLAALRFSPDGAVVQGGIWVLDENGKPEWRAITTGIDDGYDVAVLEGALSEGDRVITGRVPRPRERRLFGIRF